MKKILIPLAEGFEEVEAVTLVDVFKRAEYTVQTAYSNTKTVTGAHGIPIIADIPLESISADNFDMVVLPGGMPGTKHLLESPAIEKLLKDFNSQKKYIGAICAAPMVLGKAGLLNGKKATSYPGTEDKLNGANISRESVVSDENIITSKGPGTAMDFALAIVEKLSGKEKRNSLAKALLFEK